MADQENYQAQQERRAQENARRMEAAAREKVAQRMRENDQKRREEQAERMREQDRKRAEHARAREKQQMEMRAKAREHAREKAKEVIRKEQEKDQQKQMHGASQEGPSMKPGTGNQQRDQLEMAAALDHPGLTDGQKAELARQGVAVGEGWHNREEARKKEAEARESRKTPQDKANDAAAFKGGMSYEKRQAMEIKRDAMRVKQIEQGKNAQMKKEQVQTKAPEKTQTKAPAANKFEFTREPEEPTRGGH